MTTSEPADRPARIPDRSWLEEPGVAAVFAALNRDGDSVRAVGGAVRDALIGRPFREVDFATTAEPAMVEARAKAAGIKTVPTGIEHGTVTLVVHGRAFEVTTLREDVETDGRHAVVKFGRDWTADALRRDFTFNALSVEADGTLHDPAGGYADLVARRVRFIGDPDTRIAEDRLRILRFFRFHAELGAGEPDRAALAAAIRGRQGITALSAERIGHEMRRLVVAPGAADTLVVMQDAGVLPIVLGGVAYPGALRRLVALEAATRQAPAVPLRLAALACRIAEDVWRLADRFRLSNAERDAMLAAVDGARHFIEPPAEREARILLYRLGPAGYSGAVALAAAWGSGPVDAWRDSASLPARWTAPVFPLSGRDLIAAGLRPGPELGAILKDLESWWITEDFAPEKSVLLNRFQQRIAAAQQ
ncbi:MAG: CCA tRNA nucleotidyltransferase [Bauldia sp.]|nr:CCA tRNA nucleotidyltransferase [Bauldia sp.]